MQNEYIVVQGGGELASGVAHTLFSSGMKVIILEIAQPLCVRRTVSFAQAVLDKKIEVEGVQGVLAETPDDIPKILAGKKIPVYIAHLPDAIDLFKPVAVINATLSKKNNGMDKDLAPLTIALGPGFVAGQDVDVVVETKRGHYLGKLIYNGSALKNTGIPEKVEGYGIERVLYAPCDGILTHIRDIGASVRRDEVICRVSNVAVKAPFDGMVRGLIMNHRNVSKGIKIGDVDPRNDRNYCYTISDKARTVGGSVLQAILRYRAQGDA